MFKGLPQRYNNWLNYQGYGYIEELTERTKCGFVKGDISKDRSDATTGISRSLIYG